MTSAAPPRRTTARRATPLRVVARRAVVATLFLAALCLFPALLAEAGCGSGGETASRGPLDVVASAAFLADIAQNVAGDRFTVRTLVPGDADLHSFEPTPRDVAAVAGADLFIVNGAGLERAIEETVKAAGGGVRIVDASAGLMPRTPQPGEPPADSVDPHYWLDPTLVETYVRNVRDAFVEADPEAARTYEANAAAYVGKLEALDRWIAREVSLVPQARRKLVTDHESYGYFADRYGFDIVGAVIPSVATDEAPTARQLADLTRKIETTGAPAIFVELGQSPKLAQQIAAEAGVAVVTDLRDHSLSGPDGEAPTYIAMMKYDTRRIVEALR